MIKLTSRHLLGVLALLCSATSMAATITLIPDTPNNIPSDVQTAFTVLMHADQMPYSGGASLGLTWDPTVVTVTGITLASGSPFDTLQTLPNFSAFTVANTNTPSQCIAGPCDFDVVMISFITVQAATGHAGIALIDNGGTLCWGNPDTFDCIDNNAANGSPPDVHPVYTPLDVIVGPNAGPNIAVTDSVAPMNDRIVAFGSVAQNTTATQTVTVTNTGTTDLQLGTLAAVQTPVAPFSLANDTCSGMLLTPAAHCTVDVQFAPTAVVAYPDDFFDIPSDDPDEPSVTVTLSGNGAPPPVPDIDVTDSDGTPGDHIVMFGSVTQNLTSTKIVTIKNIGTADLQLGTLAAVDTIAAPFSLANDMCSGQLLTPQTPCTVEVIFAPTAIGPYPDDSFDIPSDDPDTPTVTVTVSGTGAPPPIPNIEVTDSVAPTTDHDVPFGDFTLAGMSMQTVTVTNSGTGDLILAAIGGANPLAAPFSITSNTCPTGALAPGNSCVIQVNFQPTMIGTFPDAFDISSNDPDSPVVLVTVTGTGVNTGVPDITVTDSVGPADDLQIPFTDVNVYGFGHQTVTVTNDGAGILTIGDVGANNPLQGAFSIVADGCSKMVLAPTESCTIGVEFRPTAIQAYNDAFDIPSDDPDENPVTIAVSGNGKPVSKKGSSALDPVTLLGLGLLGFGLRRRRRS